MLLRLSWLVGELVLLALGYFWELSGRGDRPSRVARSLWLQGGCRRVLRIFNVKLRVIGPLPTNGLLVSNHLGYLDVLVLGCLAPATFVAKRQVKHWPVFGWFAQLAGTAFVDRERRGLARMTSELIRNRLNEGALVVLFPEGTSSDGRTVLPFKSALLEPVVGGAYPVFAASLSYQLDDGNVENEVCYWRDMTLVPHLLNLLSKKRIEATVRLSSVAEVYGDRKSLAGRLRSEVFELKEHNADRIASDLSLTV